eukprot:TRINITY_DN6548_c0_g1_i1.p1 TRINITY_DN6548_c0_g1~~TRINITY_DN6548_c0_g1_i1.p1  ORF type:complete len:695 (-),score=97.83 TRINITY_DN6548_c0_g1_i1:164-2248(-)
MQPWFKVLPRHPPLHVMQLRALIWWQPLHWATHITRACVRLISAEMSRRMPRQEEHLGKTTSAASTSEDSLEAVSDALSETTATKNRMNAKATVREGGRLYGSHPHSNVSEQLRVSDQPTVVVEELRRVKAAALDLRHRQKVVRARPGHNTIVASSLHFASRLKLQSGSALENNMSIALAAAAKASNVGEVSTALHDCAKCVQQDASRAVIICQDHRFRKLIGTMKGCGAEPWNAVQCSQCLWALAKLGVVTKHLSNFFAKIKSNISQWQDADVACMGMGISSTLWALSKIADANPECISQAKALAGEITAVPNDHLFFSDDPYFYSFCLYGVAKLGLIGPRDCNFASSCIERMCELLASSGPSCTSSHIFSQALANTMWAASKFSQLCGKDIALCNIIAKHICNSNDVDSCIATFQPMQLSMTLLAFHKICAKEHSMPLKVQAVVLSAMRQAQRKLNELSCHGLSNVAFAVSGLYLRPKALFSRGAAVANDCIVAAMMRASAEVEEFPAVSLAEICTAASYVTDERTLKSVQLFMEIVACKVYSENQTADWIDITQILVAGARSSKTARFYHTPAYLGVASKLALLAAQTPHWEIGSRCLLNCARAAEDLGLASDVLQALTVSMDTLIAQCDAGSGVCVNDIDRRQWCDLRKLMRKNLVASGDAFRSLHNCEAPNNSGMTHSVVQEWQQHWWH